MKLWKIFRFEFAYQLHRAGTSHFTLLLPGVPSPADSPGADETLKS